jgi:hypothetical protein
MLLVAAAIAAACLPVAAGSRAKAPYSVDVWSSVLFAEDGRAGDIRIADESQLPPAFAAQVRTRLQNARIEPRIVDGKPATFRTGVRMTFAVTPSKGTGTVRVAGLEMAPLPIARSFVKFPVEIANSAGWQGEVTAICLVDIQGRCASTDVRAPAGVPESARRWAAASFERWRFEPQQVGGVPIAGEFALRVTIESEEGRSEDFREDKFLRLMQGR